MPPIDVPTTRSGLSESQTLCSKSMASAGCMGRSGATTTAPGSNSRSLATVPDWPDDAKPWTYSIFLPDMTSGNDLMYALSISFCLCCSVLGGSGPGRHALPGAQPPGLLPACKVTPK